jgi:hypothetical protein
MCNRYENEKPAWALASLLPIDVRITDEAKAWEPHAFMAPQTDGLCLIQQDGEWVLRTAHWSFLRHPPPARKSPTTDETAGVSASPKPTKPPRPTPVFNTRSDRCPAELLPQVYRNQAPPFPSPFWRGLRFCWMPATAWLECPRPKTWFRMALPGGEPFLLAGVCGQRDGKFRMSMTMQDAPAHLAGVHDRAPMAFTVGAVGHADPQPILDRFSIADA